jgi:hypothetical protein
VSIDLSFVRRETQSPTILGETYPTTLRVDGRVLAIHVKRFDLGEYNGFMRDFQRSGRIAKRDEMLLDKYRKPVIDRETGEPMKQWVSEPVLVEGEPQFVETTDAKGNPVQTVKMHRVQRTVFEDDATVLARIELEESDAERTARMRRDADDEQFAVDFLVHSIETYISVEPGQLATADAPIRTGAQFLRYFAGRQDVLQDALQRIYTENCLSDDVKKKLELQRASLRGSTPSTETADGDAPAPTAAAASATGSASPAAATASIEG